MINTKRDAPLHVQMTAAHARCCVRHRHLQLHTVLQGEAKLLHFADAAKNQEEVFFFFADFSKKFLVPFCGHFEGE